MEHGWVVSLPMAIVCFCLMDVVSLAACLWLVWRLCRLPKSNRRRLFPRMMMVLALSDGLFTLCRLCYAVAFHDGFGHEHPPPLLLLVALLWTFDATVLSELQLVLGLASQMFGAARPSRCMSRCVLLPWLLATTLASVQLALFRGTSSALLRSQIALAGACFGLSVLAFAALVRRARRSSDAVARRSRQRAVAYVGNFMVTFAPLMLRSCFNLQVLESSDDHLSLLYLVANLGVHANGLVNAATYFAQSRYTRRALLSKHCTRTGPSLVVRFDGVTVEDLTSEEDLIYEENVIHEEAVV